MGKDTNNCNCFLELNVPREKIIVHLMGCEEDWFTKEYDALPWYRKMLRFNPRIFARNWRIYKP